MHNPFHDNGAACTYIYILTHMYDTFIDFKKTYLQLFLGIFTKCSDTYICELSTFIMGESRII